MKSSLIGVFGGTFDPVHYGHLKPVFEVKQSMALDEVRFIPNSTPPHREKPFLSVQERVALLELAIDEYPGFIVDRREVDREGNSYMVDTLKSLRDEFPECTLCLIMGMDAFSGINTWAQSETIFELCHVIVTQRPGYSWPESVSGNLRSMIIDDKNELRKIKQGKILLKSVVELDISSSMIREKLNSSDRVDTLISRYLPEKVFQQLTKLYRAR